MVKVMVSGGFDPLTPETCIHIDEAAKLGDHLIIVLKRDSQLIMKKQFCFMPYASRQAIIRWGLKDRGLSFQIVPNIDKDMTSVESLRHYKPDIFAKGGDRTPDNMPQGEIEVCQEIGCRIIYGIGPDATFHSTDLVKKAALILLAGARRSVVQTRHVLGGSEVL
jgi:glycerol-3-phosphate cytidylyltransferase-like family protein